MLSLNRTCIYLIMLGLIVMIPSIKIITFADELVSFAFIGVAAADCIFNGNYRKYRLLWIILAFFLAYAFYSIFFLSYNTIHAIFLDFIIELKPFIPFCVMLAVAPRFSTADRKIIRAICWINIAVVTVSFALGIVFIEAIMVHPTYPAQFAIISGAMYYLCSRNSLTNSVSKKNTIISILMMCIGILGFKAKTFAIIIPSIYLMTAYKPGLFRKINIKHVVTLIILVFGVLGATWNKIQYYFLQGNSDSFDPTVIESFARPVLYFTSANIMVDHFPFGTGLASFASYASAVDYSSVYYEYGINNVHGLSPRKPDFVADAFYPSLAQYGVVGLILFIYFWIYIYKYLRILIRQKDDRYKTFFVTGSICILFVLAESTGSTTFTQDGGMIVMCILGICCSYGKPLLNNVRTDHHPTEIKPRKI